MQRIAWLPGRSWFAATLVVVLSGGSSRAAELVFPLTEATDSVATVNLILFHEGGVTAGVEANLVFVPPLRILPGEAGAPRCEVSDIRGEISGAFSFLPTGCAGEECTAVHFSVAFAPPTSRDLLFARCDIQVAQDTAPGFYEMPLREARVIDAEGHAFTARTVSRGVSVPELPRHATILIDNVEGRPGETVQLSVYLDTTVAARIERVGMRVHGDPRIRIPYDEESGRAFCEVNPAIQKDETDFYGSVFGGFAAELFGTTNLIPTGSRLFTCPVEISNDAPPGRYPLVCIRQDAYDTLDGFIGTDCVPGSVLVLPGLPGTPTPTKVPTPSPDPSATLPPTTTPRASSDSGCAVSPGSSMSLFGALVMVLPLAALWISRRRALLLRVDERFQRFATRYLRR